MMTESEIVRAQELLHRKHRLTVKGVQLACDFLGPVIRSQTDDPRILVALGALEAACALRRGKRSV